MLTWILVTSCKSALTHNISQSVFLLWTDYDHVNFYPVQTKNHSKKGSMKTFVIGDKYDAYPRLRKTFCPDGFCVICVVEPIETNLIVILDPLNCLLCIKPYQVLTATLHIVFFVFFLFFENNRWVQSLISKLSQIYYSFSIFVFFYKTISTKLIEILNSIKKQK